MRARAITTLCLMTAGGMLAMAACGGEGETGPRGAAGKNGDPGTPGTNGTGTPGPTGSAGPIGSVGPTGSAGPTGPTGPSGPGADAGTPPGAPSGADYVKALVEAYGKNEPLPIEQFPLAAAATDSVRALEGFGWNVVASWLEPLTFDDSNTAPRFGANLDFTAFLGDGWSGAPQVSGSSETGWLWVSHEYVSNTSASLTAAPTGQFLTLATYLSKRGILTNNVTSSVWAQNDVDAFILQEKKQLGGSWMRVVEDPATGQWAIDRTAVNRRYDATSNTLSKIVGYTPAALDHDDNGTALPAGVVAGIIGDCSGALTPWGTIINGEENVQDYYGDFESCWDSNNKLLAGAGCDAGGNVALNAASSTTAAFGRTSNPNGRHNRDNYGFLVEIDPGQDPGEYYGKTTPGVGHRKLGVMGRARWENATFAVGNDWKLVANKPIVIYAGDDRRSGRIFKWVSKDPYTAGMTKEQTRALLDAGSLYVAHFADLEHANGEKVAGAAPSMAAPGNGKWIHVSVTNTTDEAPNAPTLGAGTKVGDALKSQTWNSIGAFPDDNVLYASLFTALNKLGVRELNRPEDLEYDPLDVSGPRLYVAFTNHTGNLGLDANGVLIPPAEFSTKSVKRTDSVGFVFAMVEQDPTNPGTSTTFTFYQAWHGSKGTGVFDAANPDNILIDAKGGVWFGTDGNYGSNKAADSVYYLDTDPAHATTATPTFGKAFRVVAVASDAEATGPSFTPDNSTLFVSVQHPGESIYSAFPQGNSMDRPLSSLVAFSFQ